MSFRQFSHWRCWRFLVLQSSLPKGPMRNINSAEHTRQGHVNNGAWVRHDDQMNLLQKTHNAPVSYPTVHHFVTEMWTCVHISVTKWCIVGYLSSALWDLWDGCIAAVAAGMAYYNKTWHKAGRLISIDLRERRGKPTLCTIVFLDHPVNDNLQPHSIISHKTYCYKITEVIKQQFKCSNTLDLGCCIWQPLIPTAAKMAARSHRE